MFSTWTDAVVASIQCVSVTMVIVSATVVVAVVDVLMSVAERYLCHYQSFSHSFDWLNSK